MKESVFPVRIFPVPQKIGIFVGLFAVCALLPALVHSQWITGPLVNAALLLATVLLGTSEALFIGLFPSSVALTFGLLPLPLAPMVPFIMIANAIYVKSFSYGKHFGFWISAGIAAFLKFAFLTLSVIFLFPHLLVPENAERVATMLTLPQLVTAIVGAIIVFPILKILKKKV